MIDNEKCLGCKYCMKEFFNFDDFYYSCVIIRLINFKYGKSFDDEVKLNDLCHVNSNVCLKFYYDSDLFNDDYGDFNG